ncbi:target of rapamycin complex subunit lst8-like [Procambarus clarkii]|uniref:target of rapamycin complex subunit lst8 n=1 Tax=Procambarus clarkii TaxID=6728 RepID=UPI001E672E77|nr:target of rapamycin complex subunit lst8-like [Procambarus clarkii]
MSANDPSSQVILATASYDHTIKLWQAHSGICQRTLKHPESQVNALEISPDRHMLAAAGYQHIRMYDLKTLNEDPVVNYEGVSKNVTALGFQEDGKWMFTGGEDCTAKIWDLRSYNLNVSRIFQVSTPVNCACLHPNQAELFVGDQSGVIHIWDVKTEHNEQLIPEPDGSIQSIAIDPEGTYMAAVNNKGKVYVWRLSGGTGDTPIHLTPTRSLLAHNNYALKVKFSPDSTMMVTTSADHTARIWKTADFSQMTELSDSSQRWVWDVAFSADSQHVITGSSDNTARLWSVETGEIKREYSGHQKTISAIAFKDVLYQS